MDRKIIFKFGERSPEASQHLKDLLAAFGKQYHITFECDILPNASEYSDLVLTTLHGRSLDIVELGTTFVRDFLAMDGLRPFRLTEAQRMGNNEDFFQHLWRVGNYENTSWAIPWLSDVRLFFYRRDLLEKAGVDEKTAFATPAQFEQTLASLQEIGVNIPWAYSADRRLIGIHCLLSWVWYHGGQFVDETSKKVLLDSPAVIAAMQEFFRLHRFFGANRENAQNCDVFSLFINGHAAVTIGGPWVFPYTNLGPDVLANMGVAPILGHSFVGGSCLGIWKQSYQEQAALDVIQYLTGPEFQSQFPQSIGMLPARVDVLANYPLPREDFRPAIQSALETGIELPAFPLWGLIESRLATAIAKLWGDILASPNPDVDHLVATQMALTSRRINSLLAQHTSG